jgi:hypothetical protein
MSQNFLFGNNIGYKRLEKLLSNSAKSESNKTFYSSMMVGQNKLDKLLLNSAKSESNKTFYSSMTGTQKARKIAWKLYKESI